MSIVLSMFGNHRLKLHSYDIGIDEIEKALNTKIINHKQGFKTPKETNKIDELKFWINHQFYKMKFEESNWGIWLNCNHKSCDRIRLFKGSIDFTIKEVNTRYNIWKDLISNQYLVKEKYSEHIETWKKQVENWKEFKLFVEDILFKLGGDTLIYLNDFNFQDIEGDLWVGEDFENAILRLNQKSIGIKFRELIEDRENKFSEMANWFIERIKKKPAANKGYTPYRSDIE